MTDRDDLLFGEDEEAEDARRKAEEEGLARTLNDAKKTHNAVMARVSQPPYLAARVPYVPVSQASPADRVKSDIAQGIDSNPGLDSADDYCHGS